MDKTVERKAIYKTFKGNPGPCPQCGKVLKKSYQSYMVATRTGGKIADSFMMGGDFGWLCPSCPTVVLDKNELTKMFKFSMPGWNVGKEIVVLGMVNLDKIPDDKKHLPLGGPGNPIPLIPFTNKASPETADKPVEPRK
jgi:hypothetical protein